MGHTINKETKESLIRSYPPGDKWQKRRIIRVSMESAWYKIGDIITVKQFGTFGAFDIKDRWVNYWDLSLPILREIDDKEKEKLIREEIFLINKVRSHLSKWHDIPLSMQYQGLCEILKIQNDKAGQEFVYNFLLDADDEKRAEFLYQLRGHEFKPVQKKNFLKKIFS